MSGARRHQKRMSTFLEYVDLEWVRTHHPTETGKIKPGEWVGRIIRHARSRGFSGEITHAAACRLLNEKLGLGAHLPNRRQDGKFRVGNRARQIGEKPAEGQLQMRVELARKGAWVKASREQGLSLSEWVGRVLDAAAGRTDAGGMQSACKDSA